MTSLEQAHADLTALKLNSDGSTSELPQSISTILADPNDPIEQNPDLVYFLESAGRRAELVVSGKGKSTVLISEGGQTWTVNL